MSRATRTVQLVDEPKGEHLEFTSRTRRLLNRRITVGYASNREILVRFRRLSDRVPLRIVETKFTLSYEAATALTIGLIDCINAITHNAPSGGEVDHE
jgi:hypothetical protein